MGPKQPIAREKTYALRLAFQQRLAFEKKGRRPKPPNFWARDEEGPALQIRNTAAPGLGPPRARKVATHKLEPNHGIREAKLNTRRPYLEARMLVLWPNFTAPSGWRPIRPMHERR